MKQPVPFGKYTLLERISVGGMAEVFRAKTTGADGFARIVALKRILPNIAEDSEFIRMFVDEAKLAAQLHHANIAQIEELGVIQSLYYIAIEHVYGRDLRSVGERARYLKSPLPLSHACFIAMKVCEGLDYAHNKRDSNGGEIGLVHRDVSPQNVLVSFEGEVKLIDFGIAKATGRQGSTTQAGILKGKLGYMSPEQVRGLPVDRRSDVFACGIVLYEMLTGERLFLGESDFSTLEKVRNVEIHPPTTYNPAIPEELERIVLRALAREVGQRYQHAIDLHDDLQAFVYTSGEFCSRKDLASWMKHIFAKELEEESAKLEAYRRAEPDAERTVPDPAINGAALAAAAAPLPIGAAGSQPAAAAVPPAAAEAPRDAIGRPSAALVAAAAKVAEARRTQAMGSGTRPPPPPAGRLASGGALTEAPGAARPPSSSRLLAVTPAPPAPTTAAPQPVATLPQPRHEEEDMASWEDDEEDLETQIYDNDFESAPVARLDARAPAGRAPAPSRPHSPSRPPSRQPQPAQPRAGSASARPAEPWDHALAPQAASGRPMEPPPHAPGPPAPGPYLPQGPHPSHDAPPHFAAMKTFGRGVLGARGSRERSMLWLTLGGAALVLGGVALALTVGGTRRTPQVSPSALADDQTGFDLYVVPTGVTHWRLDGEVRTDRLPSRIRGIAPGVHAVVIDAPPGFMSQSQNVTVTAGKAQKVTIELPIMEITGYFQSEPGGATVTLIADGERKTLGASPASSKLDPRRVYQVLFEKPGYVSANRPIVFSGVERESIVVVLERAEVMIAPPPKDPTPEAPPVAPTVPKVVAPPPPRPVVKPTRPPERPRVTPTPTPTPSPPPSDPVVTAEGVLQISAKPPCEIVIDGKATGLSTPQREILLTAGSHRVTLINNEYSIRETFSVNVEADTTSKVVKDFTDRLPSP
ncbi:MAG: protein kinase [Kofleriaceae bacterium]